MIGTEGLSLWSVATFLFAIAALLGFIDFALDRQWVQLLIAGLMLVASVMAFTQWRQFKSRSRKGPNLT